MTVEEINKFVKDLCDSGDFKDNFGHLLVRISMYKMLLEKANSLNFTVVGDNEAYKKRIQIKVKAKFL